MTELDPVTEAAYTEALQNEVDRLNGVCNWWAKNRQTWVDAHLTMIAELDNLVMQAESDAEKTDDQPMIDAEAVRSLVRNAYLSNMNGDWVKRSEWGIRYDDGSIELFEFDDEEHARREHDRWPEFDLVRVYTYEELVEKGVQETD